MAAAKKSKTRAPRAPKVNSELEALAEQHGALPLGDQAPPAVEPEPAPQQSHDEPEVLPPESQGGGDFMRSKIYAVVGGAGSMLLVRAELPPLSENEVVLIAEPLCELADHFGINISGPIGSGLALLGGVLLVVGAREKQIEANRRKRATEAPADSAPPPPPPPADGGGVGYPPGFDGKGPMG
jgi:hypothetical protein